MIHIMEEGSSNSSKQRPNFAQDGERHSLEKVKVKKTTANVALTAHILSETMRDKSTPTYVNKGI